MNIQLFEDYMYIIMNLNDITKYTVIFLGGIAVFTVILRILLSIGYQNQLARLRFSKKEKKSKLLNKIINSYKTAGEKGIANINTEEIVNKYILRLNFGGWSFESIDKLISKIENQAGFVGVATLFITDTDKLWCAGTTALMLVFFWLIGSIFDYASTKIKLKVELIDYVDNQEGIFYVKDLGSVIVSFKNELQSTMLNTNKVLGDAINKMNSSITDSFKYNNDSMIKIMESSMKALVDYADILKEPMTEWKTNIEMAGTVQKDLNSTIGILKESITKFESIYVSLDKQLTTQDADIKEISLQTRKQVEQLFSVVDNIDENSKNISIHNEATQKQLKYVEENQKLLNVTLQKYESSIEQLASNMGNTFGNMVNIYSQNITESMVSEIRDVTKNLVEVNKEIIDNINQGIKKLTNQSLIQQQTVLDIKESLVFSNNERSDN